MLENEEWRTVDGTHGLVEVSSTGRVRILESRGRGPHEYNQRLDNWGYPVVPIKIDGKKKRVKVSRLVAKAFIPNPENKPQVNHIDGNKQNNIVANLEWTTPSENCQHRERVLCGTLYSNPRKKKPVICLNTGEIYESVREASILFCKGRTSDIIRAIRKGFSCGGMKFAYAQEAVNQRRKELKEGK